MYLDPMTAVIAEPGSFTSRWGYNGFVEGARTEDAPYLELC